MYSKYEIQFLGALYPIFFVDYGFSLFFKKYGFYFFLNELNMDLINEFINDPSLSSLLEKSSFMTID